MRNRTEEQKRQDLLKVEALETQAEQAEYSHYLNKIKEQAIKAGQDTKVAENNATLIGEMINGIAALNNSSRISIAKKLSLDITNNAQSNNSENTFNQFVGEQSGYQSNLLNKAKQLSEQGLSNEDIRQQTGWFKGIDNKWRYEINDKDATIKEFNKTKNNLVLNDVLDFKELFNIYPFLKNTKIEFTNEGYSLTNPSTNTIQLSNNNFNKKTLLHEIQHLIQSEENFVSGTTPQTYEAYKKAFENKYRKIYNNLFIKEFGKDFYNDFHSDKMNEGDFFDNFDNLLKKYNLTEQEYDNRNKKIQNEANEKSGLQYLKDKNIKNEYDFYNRFLGEIEARNVENRSNLTEQERINTPIENTQDIKNSDAIVMFSDGTIIPYNANNQNNIYYQAINNKLDLNQEVNVLDISKSIEGKITKEKVKQKIQELIDSKEPIKTLSDPDMIELLNSKKKHILYGSKNNSLNKTQYKQRNNQLLNIDNLIQNAVLIEKVENTKRDKKPNVDNYYYFYTPVKDGNNTYIVKLFAENGKKENTVNLYDVLTVKELKTRHEGTKSNFKNQGFNSSTLTISQILSNVKDINGKNALESYLEENGSNETFYQSDNNTNDKFLDTINKLENFIKENKNNEKIKQEDKQLEKEYDKISDINNINIVELIAKDRYEENRNKILEAFKDNNIEKIRKYFDVYGDSIENFLEDNDYDSNIEDYDNIDITQDMIDFAKKILLGRVEEDLSSGYYEDDIDWEQQQEYYEKLTRDIKSLDDIFYDKLAMVSNILDDLGIENILNQSNQSESTYLKVFSKNTDNNNFEYRLSNHEDKHLDNAPGGGRRELSISDSTIEIIEQIISDMQEQHEYNNDVLYQQQSSKTPKGSIQFLGDKAVINLLTNADKSTLAHELSHYYLKLLEITAEAGTQEVKNKYNEVLNIFADESNAKGDYYSTQEKFARSWEAYLRRGIAPTTKLQSIFNDFRDWLANIYRSVKNLDITLSQDAIDFFNSILTPSDLSLQEQYENNYNKLKQEIQQEKDILYQEQPNFTEEEINALLRERFMEQLTPLEDLQYKIERETNSTVKQKVNEIFKAMKIVLIVFSKFFNIFSVF